MKECPVCKSKSFDDMKTCFGCMHRFEDDEDSQARVIAFPAVEQKQLSTGIVDEVFPPEEPLVPLPVAAQQLVFPGSQARYELLISLQPIGV